MNLFAERVGEEGRFVVYIASLAYPLRDAFSPDAAIAYQKETNPDVDDLGERYGVAENVDGTVETTRAKMHANPNLKRILTFGSQGPIEAARVLADRQLAETEDALLVSGSFSPDRVAAS